MSKYDVTPGLVYLLLPIFAQALRDSGQPVVLRAIGFRVGSTLEVSLYQGEQYITTFADKPSATLEGVVGFARAIRSAGVPVRVTLLVHAGSLPF